MNTYSMTWLEVYQRFEAHKLPRVEVYGVPRGGAIVAGLTGRAVDTPEEADAFVDDIIDSGRTRDIWLKRFPGKTFHALVDKTKPPDNKLPYVKFPWEEQPEVDIENHIIRQIEFIGEDVTREGLKDTPERVVRSWDELYSGYNKNANDILTIFAADGYDEIVLLKDVELYSTCEHHILPFFGKAHIAYIPNKVIVGISKLARLLEMFARRLQVQERIGEQVTAVLMDKLKPKGAACIIEAQHLCMRARGISKQHSVMVTSSLKGVFLNKSAARAELMGLIK